MKLREELTSQPGERELTIAEAIEQLQHLAENCPAGEFTCVYVNIAGLDPQPLTGFIGETSDDGCIILACQPYETE